jgi:hypothetical protein
VRAEKNESLLSFFVASISAGVTSAAGGGAAFNGSPRSRSDDRLRDMRVFLDGVQDIAALIRLCLLHRWRSAIAVTLR